MTRMGRQIILTCDYALNKKPCPNTDVTRIQLGSKDLPYAGELCSKHQKELMVTLSKFGLKIDGTTARHSGGHIAKSGVIFTNAEVREWAAEQGMQISKSGRLPNDLLNAYAEDH